MKLGQSLPVELCPKKRRFADDAGEISFRLLIYLWAARRENRDSHVDYGKLGETMDRLPAFTSGEPAKQWWEVGKTVLLSSYPEPHRVKELEALITSPSNRIPRRLKTAILDLLEKRFIAIAQPAPAYRT